jgi:hypothetical protein
VELSVKRMKAKDPSFPLKQDFVVFEPKLSLVSKEESDKFRYNIDKITGI